MPMRSGSRAWRSRRCMPGRRASACASACTPPTAPIPTPKPWPATACGCLRASGCCCAEPALGPAKPDPGVDGRPISPVTCAFLTWAAGQLAAEGVRALALIWDNASWHISREVRDWIRRHNREVKRTGHGCRLLICRLPSTSPWLNPIEPQWGHGKRAVVEPEHQLTAAELKQRLCDHYRCQLLQPLAQQLP